jgi:hypothetical protein
VGALLAAIRFDARGGSNLHEYLEPLQGLIGFEQERRIPAGQGVCARIGNLAQRQSARPGRTALIADIHGNLAGLEVVLADICKQHCDWIEAWNVFDERDWRRIFVGQYLFRWQRKNAIFACQQGGE